ncbi:VanW family protein [Clostridioides difficile]
MSSQESNDSKFKNTMSKNKKLIIIIASIIVLIAGISFAYVMNVKNEVASWADKIYPGVQAYGIDLGGKTKDEAVNILNDQLISLIGNKVITVTVGDKTFELKYSDINPTVSADETIEEALDYGKDKKLFDQKKMIKDGVDFKVDTVLSYDEEKVKEFATSVNEQVKVDAVDAKISINGSNISITPESIGKHIDIDDLCNKIKECVDPDPEKVETVSIDLQEYSPRITSEALSRINGVMSSFSSTFGTSDSGRVENLRVSTSYINGTLLMPGDEFSYNSTIGETTPERGYKEANTYVGSKIVPGYGGGVCQVSSTLYRAVMQANIRSTERRNHSMTVGYAKPGLDATVAAGYIDYRFVNTYDFPIYIQGYLSGNKVVFNVYGNKEAMGGKTYDMVNEIVETYDYKTEEVQDPNLEEGKRVVTSSGAKGYKAKGYLITYENGVQVNKELISTDVYSTRNEIVSVGTKKVAPPVETPTEPTPEQTTPEEVPAS